MLENAVSARDGDGERIPERLASSFKEGVCPVPTRPGCSVFEDDAEPVVGEDETPD